jgi:hypothetical protein
VNATEYLRVKLPKGASVYAEDGWLRIVVAEPEQPAPSSIDADENHRVVDGVRYRAEDGHGFCSGCAFWSEGDCDLASRQTPLECFGKIWVRE